MAGVELATAYVSLVVEGSKVAPGVKKSLGAADAEASRAGDKAGRSFTSKFGGALKVGATLGAAFAVTKGVKFLGDAIEEAQEASVVTARTANVIKSMGGAAKVSAGEVADLAGAISNKVGIDDEAIQSGQNLLLTFGNLRNEAGKGNDVFDQTSQLMVDMSVAMDQDMKGSAVQLGKALNDPIKGITALSRVGVSFTEQQKKQIETAVKQNDILGAQKIILGEVKRQFGGAGEAMATPAERAKVAWGNLKEQIGTELLPTFNRITEWAADEAVPAISDFVGQFQKGKGTGGEVRDIVMDVADAAQTAAGYAADFVGWFRDMPGWAQKALAGGAAAAFIAPKIPGTSMLGKGAGGAVAKMVGVQKVFETNPAALETGGAGGGGKKSSPLAWSIPTLFAGITAPGVVSETQALFKGVESSVATSAKAIGEALEKSNLGKNAEEFGIDVGRLAQDIAKFGDEGKYFNEVMSKLTSDTGLGAFAKGMASGIIPGWHSGIEKADDATKDLLDVTRKVRDAGKRENFMAFLNTLEDGRKRTGAWKGTLTELGGETDRVGKKRPQIKWDFPGLLLGQNGTQRLGGDTDRVGKKRPSVPWDFPGLEAGISRVAALDRALDEASQDRRIDITTYYHSIGSQTRGGLQERATGGPTSARQPYLVGERGPELFMANTPGRIIPNHNLGTAAGGAMRISGVLDTPFGPAEVRGIVEDELAVHSGHDARMQGMRG